MAAGAALANRARWHKWTLELNPSGSSRCRGRAGSLGLESCDKQNGQADFMCPVAYSDKQLPDIRVQETNRIVVEKFCWDIALAPLKQLPMNLFIMYTAGNNISIFPIMMVCMMAWRPIQALMSMSAIFKVLGNSTQHWLQCLLYFIGNLLGLALAVYKCQVMGLLPTHSSDWLAFLRPPQRVEYMGGGLVL
ncbi:ER membrane protein complex subunit 4-like isoform X2 [Scyliorhinus canicula]|uniref:ER membrane protein complex subunit 4-like isoform X2 n=1 Tax=Scyliorhinus canicula TaxID=7830 RepID=UPI0018F4C9BA|nr:ER membrane protein complex subunit 4-like isoform X2 [Scyliorhinus canicula]